MSSSQFTRSLPAADESAPLAGDTLAVARAMALAWTFRTRGTIRALLEHTGATRARGGAFTEADVKAALDRLRRRGALVSMPYRDDHVRLHDALRAPLYRELMDGAAVAALGEALYRLESFGPRRLHSGWQRFDHAGAVALLRFALFSGAPAEEVQRLRVSIGRSLDWDEVLAEAALTDFDAVLFERICPQWRWELAFHAVSALTAAWIAEFVPLCDWVIGRLEGDCAAMPEHLRLAVAEALLHRGERDRALRAIEGLASGAADCLRAASMVHEGRWQDAASAFEAALKRRGREVGARKHILPTSLAWLYPLALLALRTPRHLVIARRFCIGESGSRDPDAYGWGRWAHAIGARLGEHPLDREAFMPQAQSGANASLEDLWRLMLAAWLGRDAVVTGARKAQFDAALDGVAATLRDRLRACGLSWLAGQAEGALTVLRGGSAPDGFFVGGPSERWREVLVALRSLGEDPSAKSDTAERTRIVWAIELDRHGAVEAIRPYGQRHGPRGWGKPKPLSLAKVAGNQRLAPWDAKVAQAVRRDGPGGRGIRGCGSLDRAAAIGALVGHPAVALAGAPERIVELVEAMPELEVVREADGYRLKVTPALRPPRPEEERPYWDSGERREAEALRSITVVRESPRRLRLIRLSTAQRRAAQLLAGVAAVPADAQQELQQTLRALSRHFDVQADHARAEREVPADARLRAELAPEGESLMLRLVVAPLGPDGPRLAPGAGRERLMAVVGAGSVGARRDLAAERAGLTAVLDALPFLDAPEDDGGDFEWVVGDPENALAMVEALPRIAAVAAIDWPKGRSVRVIGVDAAQLAVSIRASRDWFRVGGQAMLDEGRVMEMEALLAAARGRSRFVPMGDGVYVALTRSLKQKLAELAAVAETDRQGVRIPAAAASWLEEVLEDIPRETDAGFRAAIERLDAARNLTPDLPKGLQAQIRPYQEDGYQWAMRLAAAGLGGCLADDMGLGKTLQSLAVLLARARGGPALVVAPTSVCGNWVAEAQRFAPGLNFQIYGEGERETLLARAGASDVVVVSYTLLQQAAERFATRTWHTVIADEAQAVKNATAKRSLALFELRADLRLALSGTPVENRLSELWSIMRFANPGLLGAASRFNERFAAPIERSRDRDAQHLLRRIVAPFVLRRTKAQVLPELPPRTELVLEVAADAAEAAHYEALRRQAVAAAMSAFERAPAGEARMNVLAQLTRLRRSACDPRLVSPQLHAGAKVHAFAELAAELAANGHKALVFSQFVDFLTLLRAPLDAAGITYQYLDGATPAAERTRRVAAFQAGEGDLFLISLKAGGFGLNLTAADYVVITDPWWNPAAEDQAMGRAHRIGQSRPVTVYRLVAKGTIEERIVALHCDKRALAESILEGTDAAALPSTDELIALIRDA